MAGAVSGWLGEGGSLKHLSDIGKMRFANIARLSFSLWGPAFHGIHDGFDHEQQDMIVALAGKLDFCAF